MPRSAFASWLSDSNDVTATFLSAGQIPGLVNLGGGLPEPSTWPVDELSHIAAEVIRNHPDKTLGYGPLEGLPELRDILAKRFSTGDLQLTRDNVLVTTAGMQGLDLTGKALLDRGGLVAAQAPAYLGALDAWRPHHPAYRPMRIEANDFDATAALTGAQFAYTVPNFSNPTGRLVTTAERRALVAAAQATGTWLVEDDPYGTLYYDGPRLPRMIELSAEGMTGPYDGPVIYLGTMSKELAPGFRLGWVIAAPDMIAAMTTAKQGSDMCTSGLSQMIVARALQTGLTDRILPGILDLYRARRDALLASMDRHLSGLLTWQRPEGGMFVWATATDPRLNTDRLLKLALARGVCITPGSVFDPEGLDTGSVRINFTLNPPDTLDEGVRRLALAIGDALDEGDGTGADLRTCEKTQ